MINLLPAGAGLCTIALFCTAAYGGGSSSGELLFRNQCSACHQVTAGDDIPAVGPNLREVIGRKPASDPNFDYTLALAGAGGIWTEKRLENFLSDPQKSVPGTAMMARVENPVERADIVAYLATLRRP